VRATQATFQMEELAIAVVDACDRSKMRCHLVHQCEVDAPKPRNTITSRASPAQYARRRRTSRDCHPGMFIAL